MRFSEKSVKLLTQNSEKNQMEILGSKAMPGLNIPSHEPYIEIKELKQCLTNNEKDLLHINRVLSHLLR